MQREMKLPEGKACSDCVNCSRCCNIFGVHENNTVCDFYPIKFNDKCKLVTPARGQPMPRTIEYYKKRGDADQELILKQSVEIGKLASTINDLRQKLNRRGQ